MSNQIVKFNPAEVELVKATIAKETTDTELKLFLYQCERTGLDPFAKQIYCIKRWSNQENRNVMAIQISIDGARLVAERSGRYAGQDGPYWCGDDGVWRDVWLKAEPPRAAKVNVYLIGVERGTPGVAHWDEYVQTLKDKKTPTPMWKQMPALMLAKCAESLALRKAFPMELSGLYTGEEMAQATNTNGEVVDAVATVVARGQIEQRPTDTSDIPMGMKGDNPFEDAPKTKMTDKQRRKMMVIGHEVYGDSWDEKRHQMVMDITSGAATSSSDLSEAEADRLIAALEIDQLGKRTLGDAEWAASSAAMVEKAGLDLHEMTKPNLDKIKSRLEARAAQTQAETGAVLIK